MNIVKDINKGDVITFKATDNKYKALLCTGTFMEKSPHYFNFAALSIDQQILPNLTEIQEGCFFGIGNRNNDHFKYSEQELEKMWNIHPEIEPYFLGSYNLTIWRKDFVKFRDNLKYIGHLNIVDNLDKNGNGGINASDWDILKDFFAKFQTILPERGQKLFRVDALVK